MALRLREKAQLTHALFDIFGVLGAFIVAYFVRVGWLFSSDVPFATFAFSAFGASIVWILLLWGRGYYRLEPRDHLPSFVYRIIGACAAVGVLMALHFFAQKAIFSRLIGGLGALIGITWLTFSAWMFEQWLVRLKTKKKALRPTLIIGANRIAAKTIAALNNDPYADYNIVGCLDPYGLVKQIDGSHVLGKLNSLESLITTEKIEVLIQCDAYEHAMSLTSVCESRGITYYYVPAVRGVLGDQVQKRTQDHIQLLGVTHP